MQRIPMFLIIVLALLSAGCMTPEPRDSLDRARNMTLEEPVPPDLTGTWTGTMNGYDTGIGFNTHTGGILVLTVTEQRGRVFTGNLTVIESNSSLTAEGFAGTIGRDGRTIVVVEESGYCTGEIISPHEIELVYANDGPGFSISIDSLRRS